MKRLDLTASANLSAQWKTFKSQFAIYQLAKKFKDMDDDEQIANMLLLMGSDCVPIFDQFQFSDTEANKKKTLKNVISMFDNHFEPVKNVIYERVKFNNLKQQQGQSIHQFIVEVQTQAANCDYGQQIVDELVRDRIVVGVRDNNLREYLIDIDKLDLRTCIQKAKQYVTFHEHTAKMASTAIEGVNDNMDVVVKQDGRVNRKTQKLEQKCKNCGRLSHWRGKCPARNEKCYNCQGVGHYSKVCSKPKTVGEVEKETDSLEGLFLDDSSL